VVTHDQSVSYMVPLVIFGNGQLVKLVTIDLYR